MTSSIQLPAHPLTDSDRWAALTTRNANFASSFVYAVTTTKIYCRPNCPSRLARRANILFFTTAAAAAAHKPGFRACKRCKPDQPLDSETSANLGGGEKVGRAVAIILERNAAAECRSGKETVVAAAKSKKGAISLGDLAREVGLSKWHLQREFKRRMGVSPREMGERVARQKGNGEKKEKQQSESESDGLTMTPTTPTTTTTQTSPSAWPASFSETTNSSWEPFLPVDDEMHVDLGLSLDSDFDFNLYYAPIPPACEGEVEGQNLELGEGTWFAPSTFGDGLEVEVEVKEGQMTVLRDLFPEIYGEEQ